MISCDVSASTSATLSKLVQCTTVLIYGHAGKTIEVRRSEAAGDKGKSDTTAQLRQLFYTSTEDRNRAQIGLPPMPKPVPPPPPPSKERTQEILDDDRVKVGSVMGLVMQC